MNDILRPRVLAVEDNNETQMLLRHVLKADFAPTVTAGVDEALDAAARHTYDLLLIDINLGGQRSGLDLLHELRTQGAFAGTPAVALTAYAMPGDRERFINGGFDAYLSKPFTRSDLLGTIREVLAS